MRFKVHIETVFQAITAFLTFNMVFLTTLQVFMRYAVESSLSWTEELARLDLIYLTFFGSIVAFQRREHLRVEVLVHALPRGIRKWLQVLIDLASLLILGVVVWQGIPLLFKFWPLLSASLQWPTTVFYFPIVFCCFVMLVYTILDIMIVIRDKENQEQAYLSQEVLP